jgi:hypothetical protein
MPEINLTELIDQLTELRDELGEDAAVRVAYQQSWPLRGTIAAVTSSMDIARTKAEDDEVEDVDAAVAADTEGEPKTVWIAIGPASYSENPYAPKEVWNSSGW